MSTPYADLTPAQRKRCDAAVKAAGVVLAAAQAEQDELFGRTLAATGSEHAAAMAVAEQAFKPGGPSREQLAATYLRLREQAAQG